MQTYKGLKKEWVELNPLRIKRHEYGLSQGEAARIIGCNRDTLVAWELGNVEPIRFYDRIGEFIGDPDIKKHWAAWLDQKPVFKIPGA